MKKHLFILTSSLAASVLLFTATARAEILRDQVADVIAPENGIALVYFANGRMLQLSEDQREELGILEGAKVSRAQVKVSFSERGGLDRVKKIQLLEAPVSSDADASSIAPTELSPLLRDSRGFFAPPSTAYEPTQLTSLEEAHSLFRGLRTNYKGNSICANRAQLWSYEMWRDHGVKSMKAFLFFTTKYNRAYRHKWWYHVTPYVMVNGEEITMDREFLSQPIPMTPWVAKFMENRFECPVISHYSEYSTGQESGWCYVRKVNMYTWMPMSIQAHDQAGTEAAEWNLGQVRQAVKQALRIWDRDDFQY